MRIQSTMNGYAQRNTLGLPKFLWLLALIVIACLASLYFSSLAYAQAVPGQVKVNWTLPTLGCTPTITPCDNVPLTGVHALSAVDVYISTSPIPDSSTMAPTLTLTAGATTTTHTMQVTNGATLYARIRARNSQGPSAFSTQVTKPINVVAVPGVPTNVTIEITIG